MGLCVSKPETQDSTPPRRSATTAQTRSKQGAGASASGTTPAATLDRYVAANKTAQGARKGASATAGLRPSRAQYKNSRGSSLPRSAQPSFDAANYLAVGSAWAASQPTETHSHHCAPSSYSHHTPYSSESTGYSSYSSESTGYSSYSSESTSSSYSSESSSSCGGGF